ncbi:isoamyl acetate-hydrolyzing esterase 1 homolog [Lineus longissimus]|uniref:isoamyl acetate-hydrolyzing esterase 1 homolog n=1 Tax=Lineus longissimus TaxID=88925 RepID=UPI002B4DB2B9
MCLRLFTNMLSSSTCVFRIFYPILCTKNKISIYCSRLNPTKSLKMSTSSSESMPLVPWPEVYCFGDSLMQRGYTEDGGWVCQLSDQLIRRCDVINRGLSGYNTRWCRMVLPRLLNKDLAKNIVCATILLGANDSVVKDMNPTQHVPIAEYRENLIEIVKFFQSVGVEREKIILMAPPPCDEEKYTEYCKENDRNMSKSQTETKLYAETCCSVAEETGVEVIDLFTLMMKVDDWPKFMGDGLHFSKKGSEFVFNKLWPSIDRRTKHLPFTLPDYKDINYTNPEESLEN